MTDTDGALRDLLTGWQGRFRYPELVLALSGSRPFGSGQLALAALEGIAADHDEYRACGGLIESGEFQVAEEVLAECQALDTAQIDGLRTRLSRRKAECLQGLLGRLQHLADRAAAADVEVIPEQDQLVALCARSWPQAEKRLQQPEAELEQVLATKSAALRKRCEDAAAAVADGADAPSYLNTAVALLNAGQLHSVELLLENGSLQRPGPESVPPLRGWVDALETPAEILRWHLNPRLRPPGYGRWRPADDRGDALLEAYDALSDNNETSAIRFAHALARFLAGADCPAPVVHRVDGGYLTSITGLFAEPETRRFRPADSVELFIAGPETKDRPRLDLQQPYIAVGQSLRASPVPERTTCAVLDLGHLIEIVTHRSRVPTQLLRALGRQWPLEAFSGGSVASLEVLLGSDPDEPWHVLRWIVDLAGLGDLTTADAVSFQAGPDRALLHLFLEFLAQPASAVRPGREGFGVVRNWVHDTLFARAVEHTALSSIADSAAARAVFWAGLSSAVPGQPVTDDEILLSVASISSDRVADETAIHRGMAQLAALSLVAEADTDHVQFHRCGVLLILRGDADSRLKEALHQLVAESAANPEVGVTPHQGDWRPAMNADEVGISVEGVSDLPSTLLRMRDAFAAHYPRIELQIHTPDSCAVAISDVGLELILYELLTNAAEASTNSGEQIVRVSVTSLGTEVLVDVQDSGPGLPYPEGSEHIVFRKGESGRGMGLHLARRLARSIDGDLSVRARAMRHPILQGARLQLLLPSA